MADAASSVRVNTGGTYRMIIGDHGTPVQASGPVRINTAEVSNGETGVLSTANRDGTPRRASELKPTDRVTVNGFETTVANALRLGMIDRDSHTGIFRNATPEAFKEATGEAAAERAKEAAVKAEAERAQREQAAKLSNPDAEAAATELANTVTEGDRVAAVLQMIESGEVTPSTLARAASHAQIEPSALQAKLVTAMSGYTSQAQTYAAERGIDFDHFAAWARANHMTDVKQAAVAHATQRDVSAWSGLMQRYMNGLDRIAPEFILGARFPNGGSAHMDGATRQVIITMPNGETVSWSAALRAGLLGDLKWNKR
jgi:hypothetical protein